jgi:hypothetical protein
MVKHSIHDVDLAIALDAWVFDDSCQRRYCPVDDESLGVHDCSGTVHEVALRGAARAPRQSPPKTWGPKRTQIAQITRD